MSIETVRQLECIMKNSFSTDKLKNTTEDEFTDFITSQIGQRDALNEGFRDADRQRDLSVRFAWGHNHDFGTFSLKGRMGNRHLDIIATFMDEFGLPTDLHGMKVLDIGVWTGGTSLLLSALGATVTAIEEVKKYSEMVNYLARSFGIDTLRCCDYSLYDFEFEDEFDFVIYSGVIYHVTDPILSLRILFNALKDGGEIFVESFGTSAMPHRAMAVVDDPVCNLSGSKEKLNRGGWNYFVPNQLALKCWMKQVGFENVFVSSLTKANRYFAKGRRVRHVDILRAGLSNRQIR